MAVDINDTFGAGFIGGMVTAILYGITTLQTYLYYVYYPSDTSSLKLLVALIWVMDTLHVSLMCHALYYYLVTSFGDPANLGIGVWSLFTSLGLNATVHGRPRANILCFSNMPSHPVQDSMVADMLYRKLKLSGSYGGLALSGVLSFQDVVRHCTLRNTAFGLETVILMFIKKEFSALSEITLYAATPFAITAVLSDVFIAAALCVLLHGNRSPIIETNALVNTLIIYAINRCLLTSVVAVAEVIAFSISPGSLWFIAIDFVIGKLYANSLLASLNSRSALRGRNHTHADSTNFRINTINLGALQSSSDGDSSGGVQSKATTSTVSARAHVKSLPGGDTDLFEMGNPDRGEV
ncbi:hypothetical protein DEU56DRAFT_938788 [Suillus clintonianus]|uniref:uncharacterized protein n=1 Tax=Suillus clintonianus TaxID=1904413 RepID=UPI001B87E638|nr:uncharacterized protein DEU56DRAFT_938788 [Suillus clintonianus]KAG2143708.1 hypothetical protein DEU56DRAFT_938788 [Suillus clintonianus]